MHLRVLTCPAFASRILTSDVRIPLGPLISSYLCRASRRLTVRSIFCFFYLLSAPDGAFARPPPTRAPASPPDSGRPCVPRLQEKRRSC